jgi:hypothetical protein
MPKDGGIDPVKLFVARDIYVALDSKPSVGGILPVSSLSSRKSSFSVLSFPS